MTTDTHEMTKPLAELNLAEYEAIQPVMSIDADGTKVTYCTPNRPTAWRVQSFFTKEPETVAWLGEFAAGDVMVDVGANVGMYTIWAAKVMGARVYAFEPESQNYALLNRNIVINRLSDRAVAYCAALSDSTGFDTLHLASFEIGQSCHSFGESKNFKLEDHRFPFSQGAFATTLDSLVEAGIVPAPAHIKVDVDGFEHKVMTGAARTLAGGSVKSVLIEINQNLMEHMAIVEQLKQLGFRYSIDQVTENERLEGLFKGVANYVFRR